jgi:uncharacterized protein YaiE (UPF0345 family)
MCNNHNLTTEQTSELATTVALPMAVGRKLLDNNKNYSKWKNSETGRIFQMIGFSDFSIKVNNLEGI